LRHDAYVWQRAWTASVTNTVAQRAPSFGELIVLQAEVSWSGATPRCTHAEVDPALLASLTRPVGMALRIGSFPGPFREGDPQTTYLAALADRLVDEAEAHGLRPAELHLDFDCAESKLSGYRIWLKAIQQAVHPVPVCFTALPTWLKHREFKALAQHADGYVLQVHSFERPGNAGSDLTLCDPKKARRAVAQASALGVPFRVALPTYGYLTAFTPDGDFLGLSAEGPARGWPPSAQLTEVRSDPVAMSRLVQTWTQETPSGLTGIVWYRLPMPDDTLNWRWPTLEAVIHGVTPAADARVEVRRPQTGLVEFDLVNQGTADLAQPPEIEIGWHAQQALAMDGIQGYDLVRSGPTRARLEAVATAFRLCAGDRRCIGWIRFDADPELTAHVHAFPE
jgi:hypothetical protein